MLRALHETMDPEASPEAIFRKLTTMARLPLISVMLDTSNHTVVKAHLAVNGARPKVVPRHHPAAFRGGRPGPGNAFNAGVIYGLRSASGDLSMLASVLSAANAGLNDWVRAVEDQK